MKRSYIIIAISLLLLVFVGPFVFKSLLGAALNYFLIQGGPNGPLVQSIQVTTDTAYFETSNFKLFALDSQTGKLERRIV